MVMALETDALIHSYGKEQSLLPKMNVKTILR